MEQSTKVDVTVSLLREYFNQMAGVIADAQSGDMPMDVVPGELDKIERYWAEKLVEGISPARAIILA